MHINYFSRATLFAGIAAAAVAAYSPHAPAATAANELHVEVTGLKSSRGDVIIALYNSPKGYTKHPYKTAFVNINKDKCDWVMKDLPRGDYAIILVHDENGNHDMDSNFFGIPKEPYAFSNNVKAHLHAPPFSDTKFTVDSGETTVRIQLE